MPLLTATTLPPADPFDDPLKELMYLTIFLSMLSFFATLFVLIVFSLQLRRPNTVLRSSLNYLWIAAIVCGMLTAAEGVIVQSVWVVQGNDLFLSNRTACVARGAFFNFFRACIAGFLLCYYIHIYVVRKYDEPNALKAVKYYIVGTLTLGSAMAIFSGIEIPKGFDLINRCEGNLASMTSAAPVLVPVVVELGVVCAGMGGVFNLLCSESRINTKASRRRVFIHVIFMLSLFSARTVHAVTMVARSHFNSSTPERISDLPVAAQVLYYISEFHSWMLGFILSLVFCYSECLMFIVRRMLTPPIDDDHEGLLQKSARESMGSDSAFRPQTLTTEARLEDHLQANTLSYTVRSSSLYADGDLPTTSRGLR